MVIWRPPLVTPHRGTLRVLCGGCCSSPYPWHVLAYSALRPRSHARSRGAPRCAALPARTTRGTSASTRRRSTRDSDAIVRSIGVDDGAAPRLRVGPLRGAADRHPVHDGVAAPEARARVVRVRGRVRPRALPDPAQRADRGRAVGRRRPPRDRGRPRPLPAVRAVRRLPAPRRAVVARRLGRDLVNLRSNALRPEGWTSADAAGLPILPGLARYEEVRRGRIDHALRFTVSRTRRAYVYPARHFASEPDRPRPAGDGPAAAAQGVVRHLALPAPGADRAARAPGATG